jgi:hypothetical protein
VQKIYRHDAIQLAALSGERPAFSAAAVQFLQKRCINYQIISSFSAVDPGIGFFVICGYAGIRPNTALCGGDL